ARIHPRKNVITRALGVDEILDLDYSEVDLEEGEGILICTDGLTNFVDKETVTSVLKEHPLMECPEILVDLANENGGGDNITVVVLQK
ncbi:MAG: SpoIIE family protein phosphatase, partial [Clostridia bacterium]|nr:SpoIIE family protein phosphatase [Clostridia bacterium]